MKQQRNKKKNRSRFGSKLLIGLWTAAVLVIAFVGALAYGGYRVTYSRVNLPNLTLDGIPVGGLTESETVNLLRDRKWDSLKDEPFTVSFPLELSMTLDRMQARACMTAEDAAEQVFDYGHGTNWFDNFSKYVRARVSSAFPIDLEKPNLDENYIRANIHVVADHFRSKTADADLHQDTDNATLTMIKGGGVISLDEEKIFRAVSDSLLAGEKSLSWTEISGDVALPDFQKVYDKLAVEAKDAEYTERFEVIPEVIGCSFSIPEAERIWRETLPGMQLEIPLDITRPEVTAEDLEAQLFRDRLCFMTTYYGGSTDNRVNNIHLAADKLDGILVYPGDTFSYNEAIGQRTPDAGFLLAGAYADGEVTEEIGGGICQVSSTLYCAAMYAQMTTVSRTSHYFAVGYLGMGYDATVSWKQPDYRFRNDREYPVKIVCYYDDVSVTIEFWGTDTDGSHVKPYTESAEVYDEEYPDVLVGYQVTVVRQILDADDHVVNRIQEPAGLYHLHDQDIEWPEEKLLKDASDVVLMLTG